MGVTPVVLVWLRFGLLGRTANDVPVITHFATAFDRALAPVFRRDGRRRLRVGSRVRADDGAGTDGRAERQRADPDQCCCRADVGERRGANRRGHHGA